MIKDLLRYAGILAVICLIASSLLAGVNGITKPRIAAQAYAQEQNALREVLPEAVSFEPVCDATETLYYKGLSASGDLVGYAFKAQGKGYAGVIETMVGMTPEGVITAVWVIQQNETPGLGSRVAEDDFTGQFPGQNAALLEDAQAITGATISSRALIDSVKSAAVRVIEKSRQ